jgi:hypothetical protein
VIRATGPLSPAAPAGESLALALRAQSRRSSVEATLHLPLPRSLAARLQPDPDSHLARALTGTLLDDPDGMTELARLSSDDFTATIHIGPHGSRPAAMPAAPFRVLTGESISRALDQCAASTADSALLVALPGTPDSGRAEREARREDAADQSTDTERMSRCGAPWLVAYQTDTGAVCVSPYTRHSLLVRADGSARPHFEWPRPIVGELPFGDGGAVAWDNGMSAGSSTPSVMFRRRPAGEVIVEEIDVRPTVGTWWRGRLYWSCYPTPLHSWVGIASWAPGDLRRELPGVTAYALLPDEDALRLELCSFAPNAGYAPQPGGKAMRWRPGVAAELLAFPADGPTSCAAPGHGWSVSIHPETNMVLFRREARTMRMTCHAPLRAAWVGTSLLVSTIGRDLLLFDAIATLLDAASRNRSR